MTADELKAMSDGDLRELAEEIRHEIRNRYHREWNAKNREKFKEYSQKWYEKNRERRIEYSKEWQRKNPDKVADIQKRYRAKHPKKAAESWISKTLADVERVEEIMKYENSL